MIDKRPRQLLRFARVLRFTKVNFIAVNTFSQTIALRYENIENYLSTVPLRPDYKF